MKLSGVFSTAALVAICAVTLPPTPVEAGSLQVMGKTVHGTHQFSRRAANNSPRRLDTVVANGSHARRTFEDEVLSQHRRRAGHKKRCKSKGGSKTPSSGGHNTSDRSEGGDDSSTSSSKTASAHHSHPTVGSEGGSGHNHGGGNHTHSAGGCFPALGFKMPSDVPSSTDNWWCDPKDEVAFMGFSYSVTGCPGTDQMKKDFANMRSTYKSRYVRAYGGCDQSGFTDKMVNAAWEAGLGLYPLVWFGFDGGDQWKQRRDDIVNTVKKNPKAPFVIRGVVLGSEPLFDNVLPGSGMANELKNLKNQLKPYSGDGDTDMQVTLSEMPYAFSINQAAQSIFSAIGIIQGNVLPFFDQQASTGAAAKTNVQWNLDYFKKNGQGKKILFTQTGWPSNKSVWPGNNNQVQASVEQEKAYFDMLDDNACGFMKDAPKGGVGYFAHIYSDNDLPGWGVVKSDGSPKFKFSPKTSCD